jgi:hypothetical protein
MLGSSRLLKQLFSTDVPRLEPLRILAAKYIPSTGVVLKLKLPNGHEALSLAGLDQYMRTDSDESFLQKVAGGSTLLMEIPNTLTAKDIEAIKRGSVFRGMMKDPLYYALGFPNKENDWGRGGKQFIYGDHLLVYVDQDEQVVDWQVLDKE